MNPAREGDIFTSRYRRYLERWRDLPFHWLACELDGCPSTNGAIERFNRALKFHGGNRVDLRLEDFFRSVSRFVSNTSMRLDPNNAGYRRAFMTKPELPVKEMRKVAALKAVLAHQPTLTSNHLSILQADGNYSLVTRHVASEPVVSMEDISRYIQWRHMTVEVTRMPTGQLMCDCVFFLKKRICHHVVAIQSLEEAALVEDIIDPRNRPGRRRTTHQWFEVDRR